MDIKKIGSLNLPPTLPDEKEKAAEQFINSAKSNTSSKDVGIIIEKNEPFFARIPPRYIRDIKHICEISGLRQNAVAIEIIRLGIQQKLSEFENK